jgi:hypothetical protein
MGILAELMQEQPADATGERFRLHEPEEDAADSLEDAVDSFNRNAGAKTIVQDRFGGWFHG